MNRNGVLALLSDLYSISRIESGRFNCHSRPRDVFDDDVRYLVHDAGPGCQTLRPEPQLTTEVVRHDLVGELLSELPRRSAPGTLELVQHPE